MGGQRPTCVSLSESSTFTEHIPEKRHLNDLSKELFGPTHDSDRVHFKCVALTRAKSRAIRALGLGNVA
uniref:UvrD_C_2 domain-containing protein n=1 Tax=Steinernema glaseri TaxID=37863 RepID=A0A1I8AN00_9BILA